MRRNVKQCIGAGACLTGCRTGNKRSTNVTYIPEVLDRGGTLLSCAPVDKVLIKNDQAHGVQGHFIHPQTRRRQGRYRVHATRGVIVAASATHSPALLLRSGIRSDAMGRFFRAHPGTAMTGLYDDVVNMGHGATQGWASAALRDIGGCKLEVLSLPPELVIARLAGAGHTLMQRIRDYPHMAVWVAAVRAEHSTGRVRAPFGNPLVQYTMQPQDMQRLRTGLYRVAKMHFAVGAKAVIPGVAGLPYMLRADQVDTIQDAPLDPRCWTAILSHLFGGCVMGSDPRVSVCNEHGQVHGIKQLTIADASALPSVLGVNPQHTIMALGFYRAEYLLNNR